MRKILLGMILGALMVGGLAACGIANGDPGNGQNANNANATCNCPTSPVQVKKVFVSCQDTEKVELGTLKLQGSPIPGVPADATLLSAVFTTSNGDTTVVEQKTVYRKNGKAYVVCNDLNRNGYGAVITLAQ
jgi:hypothetical protein